MREFLCRGKEIDGREWAYGTPVRVEENTYPSNRVFLVKSINLDELDGYIPDLDMEEVIPETVGRFSERYDSRGNKVFEGDVVQYQDDISGFDIQAVVCFGEYRQDSSGGEYCPSDCVGWYIKVDNYTRPDWAEEANIHLPEYEFENSLSEKVSKCIVIGNIHDNPELIKEERNE